MITGIVEDQEGIIRVGDYLRELDNKALLVKVIGIELLNYGKFYRERINESVGLLVDISEERTSSISWGYAFGIHFVKRLQFGSD